jgi:hypothetical protein
MNIGRFAPSPKKRKFGATSSKLQVQSTLLPARSGTAITVAEDTAVGSRRLGKGKTNTSVALNALGNPLEPEASMQRTFWAAPGRCRSYGLVLSESHDVATNTKLSCSLKFYFKLKLQPPVGPSFTINVDSYWVVRSLKREFRRLLVPLEGAQVKEWQMSVVFKGRELRTSDGTIAAIGMKGGDVVYGSLRNNSNIPHRWLSAKEAKEALR